MEVASDSRTAIRSQRLIREAFLALVEEHGDSKITVVDLCRKADINRTTFYAHYDSLDDLEYKLWNRYLNDLTSWLSAELNRAFLIIRCLVSIGFATFSRATIHSTSSLLPVMSWNALAMFGGGVVLA